MIATNTLVVCGPPRGPTSGLGKAHSGQRSKEYDGVTKEYGGGWQSESVGAREIEPNSVGNRAPYPVVAYVGDVDGAVAVKR